MVQRSDTREFIVETCFDLLLKKGYDGVSITDIQNATGMSRGILYHYFGNKEALFIEAIKYHFLRLFKIDLEFVKDIDVEQMSVYLVEKYRKLTNEALKGVSIINYDFLFYRAMQVSRELASIYDGVRSDELNGWLYALENSYKRGEIRDGLDLKRIADQFVCLTDGVWIRAVTPLVEVDLIKSLEDAFETLYSLIKRN